MTEAEDEAVDLVETSPRRGSASSRREVQERREDGHEAPRVVGLEWLDPPFALGHWVPEQVRRAGGWDLLGADGEPSRETDWDAVARSIPRCSCSCRAGSTWPRRSPSGTGRPDPLGSETIDGGPAGQVFAVDGSAYFSRPGPRVIDGIELLAEIFDPDAFVETAPLGIWTPLDWRGTARGRSARDVRLPVVRSAADGRDRPTTSRAGPSSARTASARPATTRSSGSGCARR